MRCPITSSVAYPYLHLWSQAVLSGRWVVIEDIDRMPFELLSSIVSLLETNTLVLPGRGDPIAAAPGFCLFGTRTVPNTAYVAIFFGCVARVDLACACVR